MDKSVSHSQWSKLDFRVIPRTKASQTRVQILSSSPLTKESKTCPSHWTFLPVTGHLISIWNRTVLSESSVDTVYCIRFYRILYPPTPPVMGDSHPDTRVTLPSRLLILVSISWELSSSQSPWSWTRSTKSSESLLLKGYPTQVTPTLRWRPPPPSSYRVRVQDICRTKSSQGSSSE